MGMSGLMSILVVFLKFTIPDNTKTAVIKPDGVDPLLNKSYHEMARHYRTTIIPTRAGKPKDKAACENMVGNVSRRIIAALRNRQFFSLREINQAIAGELEKLINRPFQKMDGNRKTAFEKIDKPCLQPLPAKRYEYSDWKETIEIKKTATPDVRLTKVFDLIDRSPLQRGTGAILCTAEKLSAFNRDNLIVPIGLI